MIFKLGEVCQFYSGTGFPVTYQGKTDEELPFYKVGDIANNVACGNIYLSNCNNYISRAEAAEIKGTIIPKETVVFAKIGEALKLNRRAITSCDCLIDNNAMGIAPNTTVLQTNYFFYFMKKLKMQNLAESTTVPSVRKSKLEQVEIDVPSLKEQEEIESILDNISSVIRLREQELQKLDELVKARFVEMFGDQRTNSIGLHKGTLKDVADIYLGLTHTPEYVDSGRPFLSVRDISSGVIDFSNCHYITEDEFNSLPKGARPKENDLLFCRVGTIGKPVIIPEGTPKFGTFVSVGFLRKKENVLNTYLKAWMENDYFMEQVYQNVKGASQVNLNTGWLKEFEILIPSMERQIEFDNFCKQLDKSKLIAQKALDEAQLLFDSLMQKYFG